MKRLFQNFIKNQKGINTVEIIVLVAIAIGLAILFKDQITTFVKTISQSIFNTEPFTISPTPIPVE